MAATDSTVSNRFLIILLAVLAVSFYHFAGVTEISAGGSDFLSNDEREWVKSPALKVILPISQRGFGLCLAGLQKEPSARLMEPTGVDALWKKEND